MDDQRIYDIQKKPLLDGNEKLPIDDGTEAAITTDINDIKKFTSNAVDITYAELKNLRADAQLDPGRKYRIIDYMCTTAQEDTRAQFWKFDIIVTADDEKTLNENARVVYHEAMYDNIRDYYLTGKQTITDGDGNTKDAYVWEGDFYTEVDEAIHDTIATDSPDKSSFDASTEIDCYNAEEGFWEFGIQTIDDYGLWDDTNNCLNKAHFEGSNLRSWEIKYTLDNDATRFAWADTTNGRGIIYYMRDEWGNECSYDFKNMQFKRRLTNGRYDAEGDEEYVYTFNAYYNGEHEDESLNKITPVIDSWCINNKINSLYYYYNSNTIQKLNNIVFLAYDAEGDGAMRYHYGNTFGNMCYDNTFGNHCFCNTFGNSCFNNVFGDTCAHNIFNHCTNSQFGDITNRCSVINSSYIFLGDDCDSVVINPGCHNIYLGTDNNLINHCRNITVDEGNSLIYIVSDQTSTEETPLKNVRLRKGVNNSIAAYLTVHIPEVNKVYETTVAHNTNNQIKVYCEADDMFVKVVDMTSSSVSSATIDPNKFYKFGTRTNLTIQLNNPTDNNIVNEYQFEFKSGSTATTLSLPASVIGIDSSSIKANMTYHVSIVNNVGVIYGA